MTFTGSPRYVCIECGAEFPSRVDLQAHWLLEGDGPRQAQQDALELTQLSIGRQQVRHLIVTEEPEPCV
jgi:hypothetical protein